jgi:hypothetical protein
MKKFILLVLVATLAGCSENTPVQTVDWYKEHSTERKEMLAKCKANPGQLGESANCVNAQQADNQNANARRGWTTPNAVYFGKKGG